MSRRAELAKHLEDRIAFGRLERDRIYRVGLELRKTDLARAVQLMDEAVDVLCTVRRELLGEP